MTTMSEAIERNNKMSAINKALELKKIIAKVQGTYVKRTVDISDARKRVAIVNAAIEEYNAREDVTEKLEKIDKRFRQVVTSKNNDKLPMIVTVNQYGLNASIGSITLRHEIGADDWKEVKTFGIQAGYGALDSAQHTFVTTVSEAARKLAHSYGLVNMNVDKRIQTIVGEKLKECARALEKLEALKAVKVEKAAV